MLNETSARTKTWVLALTSAGSLMAVLDAMVVATALSTIRQDLDASIEALEWTVNAYNLSFAVLLLTGAALGDRFGRRRMFLAGLGLFVASSAACALAGSAGALIAARAVQGAGAALLMPLAMALLGAAFPPQERGWALGVFSGVNGLALIAGPMIGGAIAEGAAWQWIFWLNVPLGLAIMPLARARLPESRGPAGAIDSLGVALVSAAALGSVWGLMRANAAGWSSPEVVLSLAAGLVLAFGFVMWERRAAAPMVPLRFFGVQAFAAGIAASFLFYAAMYGILFFLPQFFQIAQGNPPLAAGFRLLPWTATTFLVAPLAGRAVNRVGERPLLVTGLVMQAAGMAWIGLLVRPDLTYGSLVAPLMLAGAGVTMAMPAAQNAIMNAVTKPEVGKASGVFNMFRFLGGVFGIAITVALFAGTGDLGSPQAFSAGFGVVLDVSAALSLFGAAAGLWLPARSHLGLSTAAQGRTGSGAVNGIAPAAGAME